MGTTVQSTQRRGVRAAGSCALAGWVLVLLAGCGTWGVADSAASGIPGPTTGSSPSSSATAAGELDTPILALHRLYRVADALDADPKLPITRIDAVAVGSARGTLATAIRHRRSAQAVADSMPTSVTQIVARPSERSGELVTAVVQFCASRQIEARTDDKRQVTQPTTVTFRYQSGHWRAYAFGFVSPDCGCSQPVQCG